MRLDSTHHLNAQRIPTYLAQGTDGEGRGHMFGFNFLVQESKSAILSSFAFMRDEVGVDPETIVIDKDSVALAVLRLAFPAVSLLLCRFHAIKYFEQKMSVMFLINFDDYTNNRSELMHGVLKEEDKVGLQTSLPDLVTSLREQAI